MQTDFEVSLSAFMFVFHPTTCSLQSCKFSQYHYYSLNVLIKQLDWEHLWCITFRLPLLFSFSMSPLSLSVIISLSSFSFSFYLSLSSSLRISVSLSVCLFLSVSGLPSLSRFFASLFFSAEYLWCVNISDVWISLMCEYLWCVNISDVPWLCFGLH